MRTETLRVMLARGPVRSWRTGGGLVLRELANGVWPLLTLALVWLALHALLPANTFLKGPIGVAQHMAADGRIAELLSALLSSLGLVVLGYVVAVGLSLLLASGVVLSRVAESAIMPIAVIVGSIPIIVITPVVLMLAGRGVGTAVVVCTIVTFFPCFINIIAGMRSPATQLVDLTRTLGGSRLALLVMVRLPSAVPGLVSASKLALPAALSGVILTEFIATGTGIGNYINHGRANFLFNEMWAGIAATLIASVVLYSLLGAAETLLSRRFSATGARSGNG